MGRTVHLRLSQVTVLLLHASDPLDQPHLLWVLPPGRRGVEATSGRGIPADTYVRGWDCILTLDLLESPTVTRRNARWNLLSTWGNRANKRWRIRPGAEKGTGNVGKLDLKPAMNGKK